MIKLMPIIAVLFVMSQCLPKHPEQTEQIRPFEYQARIQQSPSEVGNILYDTLRQEPIALHQNWLEPVIENVKSGKIKVYANYDDVSALSMQEVAAIFQLTDSIWMIDSLTLEEEIRVLVRHITWRDIRLIAFYEQWTVNPNGKIQKKVLAYAPVYEVIDTDKHFRNLRTPLFWIKQ